MVINEDQQSYIHLFLISSMVNYLIFHLNLSYFKKLSMQNSKSLEVDDKIEIKA